MPIRRQVRGAGEAAGKSFCGRMRRLLQEWNGEDHESVRGDKNQGQWDNLRIIHQQMKEWFADEDRRWRLESLITMISNH